VNLFTAHAEDLSSDWKVVVFFTGGEFNTLFSFGYIILIIWAIVVSLAGPLDKAMIYFYIISALFSFLTIASLIGIGATLIKTGINAQELDCIPDNPLIPDSPCTWKKQHRWHKSYLTISGIIMIGVFILPIVMRPMDALFHLKGYLIGMLTYIFMLPTFINIMAIYSMSNLHDVTWGNRPAVG